MSTRRRIGWFVGIGVSQICLTVLAVYCIQLTTEYDRLRIDGGTGPGNRYLVRGGPVIWSASSRRLELGPGLETLGSPHHRGSNPVVPALMIALAISLPPAVAGCVARRRKDLYASRPRASRVCRSARVVVLAATAGLTTAAVEAETARDYNPGPFFFIDRSIEFFRPDVVIGTEPDGAPIYGPPKRSITSSDWYWEVTSRAMRVRRHIEGEPHYPYPAVWESEFDESVFNSAWRLRRRITLAATGLGLLIGCLVFRPWRRAGGPSASDGAAATTPPSA
jgi:hypothetical protein